MTDIKSGSIGINITRNQDTAFGVSLQLIEVGKRHLECPTLLVATNGRSHLSVILHKLDQSLTFSVT
ncbi:hypothetical protein [Microcoleus sp. herbarium14]|uniref:hypothetical protein n=1 Tax=Microcoleus sp. herbarium14 TaxID=3055439 RepID=UPI002FD47D1C